MTNNRFVLLSLFAATLFATSCSESPAIKNPGDNSHNQAGITTLPEPDNIDIPDGTLTVGQARKICSQLASGTNSSEKYYVKGWIQSIDDGNATAIQSYGNAIFTIAGVSTGASTQTLIAYQVYGKDGKKIQTEKAVEVGDFVVLYGPLTNYNGTYETAGRGAAYIYSSTNDVFNGKIDTTVITPDPEGADVPAGTLNVYQANALCDSLISTSGSTTNDKYYIKGYVRSMSDQSTAVSKYGNVSFTIAPTKDDSSYSTFYAFQVYGKDQKKITSTEQVQIGDFVVIYGQLINYNGTYETKGQGNSYIYYSTNEKWAN